MRGAGSAAPPPPLPPHINKYQLIVFPTHNTPPPTCSCNNVTLCSLRTNSSRSTAGESGVNRLSLVFHTKNSILTVMLFLHHLLIFWLTLSSNPLNLLTLSAEPHHPPVRGKLAQPEPGFHSLMMAAWRREAGSRPSAGMQGDQAAASSGQEIPLGGPSRGSPRLH